MPPGPHAFKSPKADSIPASVLQILKRPSLTQSFSSDPSPPSRPLSPTPALASTPTPIPAPPQRAPAATAPQPPSSPKLSSATTTLDPPYHPTAPVTPRFTHQTLAVSTRTPTTPTTPRLTFHTLTVTSIPRPAILPTPGFTPLSLHLPPVTPLTPTLLNLTTPPTPPTVTGPQFAVLHEPRITATAAMSLYPAATAGSQLDLNHLWQQVQELSALLAQNRESAQGLVKRADEIRNRPDHGDAASIISNGVANGNISGDGDSSHPSIRDLESIISRLESELAASRADNEDLTKLVSDYSSVLEKVLEGLRVYAHEHSQATINIHSSYTQQLASERASNAALRQEQADDRARLVKISTLLREAYSQETALGPDIVIARLKAENKALREALALGGIGPLEDEDGENRI